MNGRACDATIKAATAAVGRGDTHRNAGSGPIVAVDHADCQQGQDGFENQAPPLHPVDRRPTDDDALSTRIEGLLQGVDRSHAVRPLALRVAAFAPEPGSTPPPTRPVASSARYPGSPWRATHRRGFLNSAAHELAQLLLNWFLKAALKSTTALRALASRFTALVGSLLVGPDLRRQKCHQKGVKDAQRWQDPWRDAFERTQAITRRQRHDQSVNRPCDQHVAARPTSVIHTTGS